jgi:hypothetical protein
MPQFPMLGKSWVQAQPAFQWLENDGVRLRLPSNGWKKRFQPLEKWPTLFPSIETSP